MTEVPSKPSFDRGAASYDAARRLLIPCFDAFYGAAFDLIEDWRGSNAATPLNVLDIGAGTGLFAAMLLARYPDARIELLDASDGMLAQARQRFAGNPGISFAVGDMTTADIGTGRDLIVSSLAIHHADNAAKQALFRRIRAALRPGGLFVNAEQVLGPTSAAEERYAAFWLQQVRALGAAEADIAKAQERMQHDRCAPVEPQLQWMREAGLTDVDCSFKAWRFAVLSGRA